MKKLILSISVLLCAVSCSTYTYTPVATTPTPKSKHTATAAFRIIDTKTPMTSPLIADLDVSKNKIVYTYTATKDAIAGGKENVVKMAVWEALVNKGGNADILIGMQYQTKYNNAGEISSVTVTGYPARYVKFRHPSESIWLNENTFIKEVKVPTKQTK